MMTIIISKRQKNLDLVQDESQKDVDEYLKLFIDYRLKLREAYEQGLDTTLKFQREFKTYRNQLARNFLTDNNVTEACTHNIATKILK